MKKIKELYQKHILEHSRNPVNEMELSNPDLTLTAYNPLCGDKFTFYLKLKDQRVLEASFTGYGCSISKASSSILVKKLKDSNLKDLNQLIADFLQIVNPDSQIELATISEDEELLAFSAARDFPERIQCATLGWKEFEKIIRTLT